MCEPIGNRTQLPAAPWGGASPRELKTVHDPGICRLMLPLDLVRILAVGSLVATVGGFVLGRSLSHPSRGSVRVVARGDRGRWTEVVWVVGSLLVVLWPVGLLVAPAYAYHWPALPDFPDSAVLQLFGFSVALAGGALFYTAARALGRHMTPAIQVQEDHRLVQDGPYRYVRHPVYTAILLGGSGLSLLYLSAALALIVLLLGGMALQRARLEEELLSTPEAFGKSYREYAARTGRFLPRIRSGP